MKYLLTLITAALLFSSCVKDRVFPTPTVVVNPNSTLLHYWNFNGTSTTTPSFTIGGGNLSFDFTTVDDTMGYADLYTPTTTITNINAQNGDTIGNLLRVRNPCLDFIITAPTTGYKDIVLSYSVAKSNSGASTDNVSYTIDGTNYITSGLSTVTYSPSVDPSYTLETFDFSSITSVINNPNFKFKISFSSGNLATSGNNRFDNITVTGVSISGGAVPVISSAAIASGTVNTAFAGYTIAASNTPTSFAVTGQLVPGLSINTSTGVISGTPTTAGTYIDTIKATNAAGTGVQVLAITINPSNGGTVPVISSVSTASGTVNTAFAGYTIAASNTPTSFAITGQLVPGLTINTSTGIISGTPTTAGTYIDTIKAINAHGTGVQVLTITINSAAVATTMYLWNFNNITSLATAIAPTTSINNNAGLSFDFTGAGYYDTVAVSPTQPGIADGEALRVRNPSVDFIITAPTTGYKNIILSYATDISSATNAALTDSVYYSIDGGNTYTNSGLSPVSYTPPVDPSASTGGPGFATMTYDLSAISTVNSNANFKFKIVFSNGNTGTKGNTRFDNLTITGILQ